jgi:lariat debranching enzyme
MGGWLAPNVYYLGAAGCVSYKGLVIAGISGIYKSGDYYRGEPRIQRSPHC